MIDELRRFILVVEERNITKAAEKIFITQSAMTQSIQRLEKEVGAKLFVQNGKSLELTTDGAALKTIGDKILQLWERAKDHGVRRSLRPTITIGMFDNAAQKLAGFVQTNLPGGKYNIEFIIDNSGKLLAYLQLGVIDIALLVKKNQAYPKDIECIGTFGEELIPVAAKRFPGNIKDIPFILFNKGSNTREQIDNVFIQAGIKPKIIAESTSPAFMKELAILNCGAALLPINLVKLEIKQKVLIELELPIKFMRQYGIYIHKTTMRDYIDNLVTEMFSILHKGK